jgi:hypothetical protein
MEIEIDGIKYQKREQTQRKSSGRLNSIMLMAAAMGGLHGDNSYNRPAPQVDIAEEYKLVLQKKSKLCRRDREYVQWAFEQLYKKISE